MRIARWYCRDAHMTFSALPDCMAARVAGSLETQTPALEHVEDHVPKMKSDELVSLRLSNDVLQLILFDLQAAYECVFSQG